MESSTHEVDKVEIMLTELLILATLNTQLPDNQASCLTLHLHVARLWHGDLRVRALKEDILVNKKYPIQQLAYVVSNHSINHSQGTWSSLPNILFSVGD